MYILESPLNLINIIIIMHWLALPRQMRGGGGEGVYLMRGSLSMCAVVVDIQGVH